MDVQKNIRANFQFQSILRAQNWPIVMQASLTILLALIVLMMSGLNSSVVAAEKEKGTNQSERPEDMPESDESYIIGIDDRIMVSVWRNAELSLTVPVRPDGRISTPLVGDIVAAGKTPMELSKDIEKALSSFVREPHVSIIVVGLASHEYLSRVRITGAVRSPSTLPHRKGMTVLDLVLAAGGPNDFAAANRTVLYRSVEGKQTQRIRIKLDDLLKKGRIEANVLLLPGDIITVPESLF